MSNIKIELLGGLVKGILEQKNTLEQGSSISKDHRTQIVYSI